MQTEVMARPALSDFLDSLAKVPGNRQILMRLYWLLDDEGAGAQQLVEVLRMDAGLSARVIAAANTVFFRGGTPVSSVVEAVVRVGASEIRKMLLGSIAHELTMRPLRAYAMAPGDLWARSLVAALAMDAMARQVSRSADVCYTVGMLHPLGMVALDRWIQQGRAGTIPAVGSADAPDRAERERQSVGWTSPEIGAHLLESWKFSESVVAAVRHQDDPLNAGRFQGLAGLLALARWLALSLRAETSRVEAPADPDPVILRLAGIEQAALGWVRNEVKKRFADAKAALGTI